MVVDVVSLGLVGGWGDELLSLGNMLPAELLLLIVSVLLRELTLAVEADGELLRCDGQGLYNLASIISSL